jgi:hypothetical protein
MSEYEIKEFKGKIKDKNGKDKFEITEFVEKDKKLKEGENETQKVKVKVKESTNEGKD